MKSNSVLITAQSIVIAPNIMRHPHSSLFLSPEALVLPRGGETSGCVSRTEATEMPRVRGSPVCMSVIGMLHVSTCVWDWWAPMETLAALEYAGASVRP